MSLRLSALRTPWIFVAALSLILIGCSQLRFAYNQLDWAIPYYVGGYVSLTDEQSEKLDSAIEEFLHWHCSSQIPEYLNVFREWQALAEAEQVSRTQIWKYVEQTRGFWKALAEQSARQLSPLVLSLNSTQIDELFDNLADKNTDFGNEYVNAEHAEIEQVLYEHMVDRLETWLDDLQPQQLEWVKQWSRQARAWQAQRLQVRLNWQTSLRQSWLQRVNPGKFQKTFNSLLVNPEQTWPAGYADTRQQQREAMVQLLEKILNSMDAQQRRHLQNRLGDWADDLARLSCVQSTVAGLDLRSSKR